MPLSNSERQLMKRATQGDLKAFSDLYVAYQRSVFLEILALTKNPHETDDLVSETFLRAWNAIRRFEDRGYSIEAWLLKIARNLTINHLERRNRESVSAEMDWLISPIQEPEEHARTALELEAVRQALLGLPPVQRQVLGLRFFDDLSYNEVAERIGKPQSTVRVIQHRALRSLGELLEKSGISRPGGRTVAKPVLPPVSGGGE